jgi:flagellar hook-basal body complex protein FliE
VTVPIGPLTGVSSAAFTPLTTLAETAATRGPAAAGPSGFGDAVIGALDDLSAAHRATDALATQAATGQLADVHDYTIAATEASLATELTVAVRNKAVEAFTSIMNMPL